MIFDSDADCRRCYSDVFGLTFSSSNHGYHRFVRTVGTQVARGRELLSMLGCGKEAAGGHCHWLLVFWFARLRVNLWPLLRTEVQAIHVLGGRSDFA